LNPLISIIIPSFNRGGIIAETLASVEAQTYSNWECIIVDDGSTDQSAEVIKTFEKQNDKFKFLARKELPKGANKCRNIGIEQSSGEYLVFLDSDDLFHHENLEKRIACLQNNGNADGVIMKTKFFQKIPGDMEGSVFRSSSDYLTDFYNHVCWQTQAGMWKRALVEKAMWDEDLLIWQDWDFGIKLLIQKPSLIFCDGISGYFRRGEQNRLGGKRRDERYIRNKITLFNKHLRTDLTEQQRTYVLANALATLKDAYMVTPSLFDEQFEQLTTTNLELAKNDIKAYFRVVQRIEQFNIGLLNKIARKLFTPKASTAILNKI